MYNIYRFILPLLILVRREPNIYQNLVCFTRNGEDCGVVSDCEELVGLTWRVSDSVKN